MLSWPGSWIVTDFVRECITYVMGRGSSSCFSKACCSVTCKARCQKLDHQGKTGALSEEETCGVTSYIVPLAPCDRQTATGLPEGQLQRQSSWLRG